MSTNKQIYISDYCLTQIVRLTNQRATTIKLLTHTPMQGANCSFVVDDDGFSADSRSDVNRETSRDISRDFARDGSGVSESVSIARLLTHKWAVYTRSVFVDSAVAQAISASLSYGRNNTVLQRKLVNASIQLAASINRDVLAGPGVGRRVFGLANAIGCANNTCYGIDRTDPSNAFFRPFVSNPGTLSPLTKYQIRNDLRQIYDVSNQIPDIAICSPAVFDNAVSLYDRSIRWVSEMRLRRGIVKLPSGGEGANIEGCTFFRDWDAAPHSIAYVNTNYVELAYLLTRPSIPPVDTCDQPAGEELGIFPFGASFAGPADDQSRASVRVVCQLAVSKPNTCGMRWSIAT